MFRNTLKMILNSDINIKTELLEMLEKHDNMSGNVEIEKKGFLKFKSSLIPKLKEIMDDYVNFVSFDGMDVDINDLYNCFGLTKDECRDQSGKCAGFTVDNKKCSLLIPESNLITKRKNNNIYFERLADELIRKKSIKKYVRINKLH